MTPTGTIVYFLLVIGTTSVSSGEYSGILARLYRKAVQSNRPLILVLDNEYHGKAQKPKPASSEVSNKLPFAFLYKLAQDQKKAQHQSKYSYYQNVDRDEYSQKQNYQDKRYRKPKHSPPLKKLLRYSNSLRCGERDECESKCNGNKVEVETCEAKCEVQFSCEEERDPCEESNDCEEPTGSTKGETLVTEKYCPRC